VLAGLDRRRKQEAAVVEIPMRPQPEDSIAEPEEAG